MTFLERQCWAALWSVPGIGPVTFQRLQRAVTQQGYTLVDVWYHWPELINQLHLTLKHQGGLRFFQRQFSLDSYWQSLSDQHITVVTDQDKTYSQLLARCEDRPAVLFVKGVCDFWNHVPIAVVGTRRMTQYGQLVTEKMTTELVVGGQATIVSGFMYGVDVLAHRTALKNAGKTVGVLGFGFNYLSSRHHGNLMEETLAQGSCLVTELPPATPPSIGTFPARNRIIAGLSLATVVTEAAEKSGSHITASHAAEYGRLVAAVPGPITNHFSEGTKNLVKQGAVLVTSGYEVLDELQLPYQRSRPLSHQSELGPEKDILHHLTSQPMTIDHLVTVTGWTVAKVTAAVTMLELAARIKRVGDQWTVV